MDSIAEILELADEYESELPALPALPPVPPGAQIACKEAQKHNFASVCVNPAYVPLASRLLADSQVLVCTVAGFPLGATLPTQKSFEALSCILFGASEIDMVMNIGALKSEAYGMVLNDVQSVAQTAHNQKAILKVFLETPLLTRREKIIACLVCKAAGADFVNPSTGLVLDEAAVKDVDLVYRVVGPKMEVKAAGGIGDYETATAMIRAGATRLGASASVKIIREALE